MTTIYITGVESVLAVNDLSGEPNRELTSILSVSKLPEYIRGEYPSLATFVKEYYTYLERMESVSDASGLDSVSEKYLERYKDMVLRGFGTPKFMDMRKFISTSKEMFKLKGTDEAFKYFFRAYFGEEIEIKPSTYLVASGGDISGDTFFHCRIVHGTLDPLQELTIVDTGGNYKILVDTATFIDEDVYRITFKVPRGFKSNIGDTCIGYTAGIKSFHGVILPSPSRMVAVSPGKYWKRGQLVQFPAIDDGDGDVDIDSATLARVRTVDTDTGIASLEIIQHGFPHYTDQTYIVSPFEFRPNDSATSYTQQVSGYTDGVPTSYNHVLNIVDNIDPMSDGLIGVKNIDEYPSIVSVNTVAPTISVTNDTNTYARWLESRATIRIEMSSIAREFQVYRTNDSLLSDENTKLHDSLYYQAFAYSLISNQDLEEYKGSIDLIHPAGMKFHALMTKIFQADETGNIDFSIVAAVDTFFWNETLSFLDDQSKLIIKALATDPNDVDTFTTFMLMLEEIQSKQMIKPLTDTVESTEADAKHVLKPLTDSADHTDAIDSKEVLKPLFDYPETIDAIRDFQVVKPLTDATTTSAEVESRAVIKPLTDTVASSDDTEVKSLYKVTTDSAVISDSISSFQSIKPRADSATITESLAVSASKPYSESINTSDGTPVLEAESRFNITGYAVDSVDNYFYSGITITIS